MYSTVIKLRMSHFSDMDVLYPVQATAFFTDEEVERKNR